MKARGIARDLFGTDDHYVIPVQSLRQREDLVKGFRWLWERKDEMKDRLLRVMPEYQKEALLTGKEVDRLWEEFSGQQGI